MVVSSTALKRKLSWSTNGKWIKIAATATAGTAIHTSVSGTTDWTYDEIRLRAQNNHTAAVNLTIEFGWVTDPDNLIIASIPSKSGLYLVVPGLILQNAQAVAAFASVADVVTISGFVNTIADWA
jgi:hypothetical protein